MPGRERTPSFPLQGAPLAAPHHLPDPGDLRHRVLLTSWTDFSGRAAKRSFLPTQFSASLKTAWRRHLLRSGPKTLEHSARDPGALDLAALHLQLQMDVAQLRQEREELRQQVAFLAEALREAEAENQEQRARMGRLAQEASSLGREFEEAQCKAWSLRREAEGLRAELSGARALLREARRERMELEARWVQEKALEAQRLNGANRRQEKYQRKVTLLQETLERMREASAAATGDADGTEEGAPAKGSSLSSSSEEAEMDTGGGCGGGQAEGRPPSPLPLPAGAEAGRS
nr:autophagy-related protein 16-like isoform X1 [Anolis sagrei ordinatus]